MALSDKHALSVERLTVAFPHGDQVMLALDGATFEVKRGEFVCVVGASGSGKSTLLNVLAGLDRPSGGRAHVHGRVALIFQESALLPWLTAAGNVELALELRGVKASARQKVAHELLNRVHLAGFERRRPHELSGGMKQRAALARALAQEADVLLMDEPFAALDAISRDLLHEELERIWTESHLTILFVTHNAREAVRLGDRVIVLTSRPGRVAHEVPIDLPRPRSLDSPELAVIAGRITDRLKHEMSNGR
ncbi:MAG: ABC transporter ATP-binding protein [Chloroflexi bacterium]|nr:MAG: ABC transporter ATP-binding protein [Chloroflexota bacterium]TME43234.1 MAG: ABC transporter ATP-binding protein [Chloroflexota bacterium]TME51620.1 MAG: ABC transporter ATP-binding protein [Chloroflexota bacterium]